MVKRKGHGIKFSSKRGVEVVVKIIKWKLKLVSSFTPHHRSLKLNVRRLLITIVLRSIQITRKHTEETFYRWKTIKINPIIQTITTQIVIKDIRTMFKAYIL